MKPAGGVMAETTIRALPNGPYRVTGPAKVIDPLGNEIAIEEGRTVSLCRCGGSVNKPYCDGTHSRIGFQAAEAAVKKSG
jgi:CDGSH-type Zn-finger protein